MNRLLIAGVVDPQLADYPDTASRRLWANTDRRDAVLLASMPGVSYFTAVSLACCVGRVERFPRSHSLANYWGLTPGCRNSGANNQRLGSLMLVTSRLRRGGGRRPRREATTSHSGVSVHRRR